MTESLAKEITVEGQTYVVLPVDAQTQYKILQKTARYGVASLLNGFVKAEAANDKSEAVKLAFAQSIVAIISNMPDDAQDYCIENALAKTSLKGEQDPITIDHFSGRIGEYVLVGARAIGVQLGDFSCFRSLIKESMAEPPEEND